MTKIEIIETVPFLLSFREFVNFFEKNYGEIKLKNIFEKVHTSKKCTSFLHATFEKRIRPGTDDYLTVINSSSSFLFAKAEVISMATTVLLHRWDDAIGKKLQTRNDYYLNKVFFSILEKCDRNKTHISSSSNFFTEFHTYLSNYVDNSRFAKRLGEMKEVTSNAQVDTSVDLELKEKEGIDYEPTYEEEQQNIINYISSTPPTDSEQPPKPKKTKKSARPIASKATTTANKSNDSAYFIRGILYCGTCNVSLDKDSRCSKCRAKYDSYGKRSYF